jgi:Ser-tRNA(Ala) deacylase AlaX
MVTLRDTVFYALSGGQESDAGTIGGFPVLEAKKAGLDIHYLLPVGHQLNAGDRVRVEIDWARRYALMRLHFAAELVLELTCRELAGIVKIGAHIGADKARIDFHWPESIAPHLPRLASQAQALVDRDLAIVSAFSEEEAQKRYWEVAGFARVACGGTHLRRTGEVGEIALRRKNMGRQKERIEVHAAAGRAAA